MVTRRELHAGAGGLLAYGRAVEFLPRGLVGGVGEAAFGLEVRAALLQLLVRDQDIGAALVEVDADLVAVLEDGEATVGSGFPVSYTHLRAHETGRNLVCRLLLEKKKKT